jgi:hypothetical protein
LDVKAGPGAGGSFSSAEKLRIGSPAVNGGRKAAAWGSFGGEALELARALLGGREDRSLG